MTLMGLKAALRPIVPVSLLRAKKIVHHYLFDEERTVPLDVLRYWPSRYGRAATTALADQIEHIHSAMRCAHTHEEAVAIVRAILALNDLVPGVIVEAGCFKGGSTAKLSLAARLAGRPLLVFDSFEGLPAPNKTVGDFNESKSFFAGEYAGTLEEVKANVTRLGIIETCEFHKGWFDDTLPKLKNKVAVAFVDVDLSSSVATCLRYLYPLLSPGGTIFSHDGHIPTCVQTIRDWAKSASPTPHLRGLGNRKLVMIEKPR